MYFRGQKKLQGEVSLNEALDTGPEGDALYLGDVVGEEDTMLEELQSKEDRRLLHQLLARELTPREADVLRRRYGLDGHLPQTQRQVAAHYGISRSYVSRIEKKALHKLEEALRDRSFGAARMADTLCQQMLIDVNRDVLRSRTAQEERDSYRVDPKMEEVLRYILDHLGEELTVESLSKRFFISRYYLMHRFKAVTGYTVHQYISQKRLLRAGELIRAGVPVMKAAEQAGFEEYSTFLRAFRGTFHMSPREFR